jgi:4-oxalomesaconate tautomerase
LVRLVPTRPYPRDATKARGVKKMQIQIPAVLYRGGTSKGPLFLASNLPADPKTRDAVLLAVMGSPHARQIDGLGGAESLTSKVAIVSRSKRSGIDVDYLFAQVTPNSDIVDYFSNCGNMLSAVGPFAIEQGLVAPTGDESVVRIFNVNSNAPIEALIQTPAGEVTYDGEAAIDGVSGTAAPVRLNFARTTGSTTGKVLPTDIRREIIDGIEVSCIDTAVPTVIIPAAALGKSARESKTEINADKTFLTRLESIRRQAGLRMGLGDVAEKVIPKPLLIGPSAHGGTISARDFVPYECHAAFSVTGSIGLSTACCMPGTVANEIAGVPDGRRKTIRIEHPSGTVEVDTQSVVSGENFELIEATLLRTCRKLFAGAVFIPAKVWPDHAQAKEELAA